MTRSSHVISRGNQWWRREMSVVFSDYFHDLNCLTKNLDKFCGVYFFTEDKLYIIMELVEGAPLGEHFSSLKEKGTRFSEERIWHIFIQVLRWKFLVIIIYPLNSSLACILIKFVQSAVFTIGDPGFLFLFPFTLFYLFPPFPLLYLLICFRVYRWACLF